MTQTLLCLVLIPELEMPRLVVQPSYLCNNLFFGPEQNGDGRLATLLDGTHPLRLRLNGDGHAVLKGRRPNRMQELHVVEAYSRGGTASRR